MSSFTFKKCSRTAIQCFNQWAKTSVFTTVVTTPGTSRGWYRPVPGDDHDNTDTAVTPHTSAVWWPTKLRLSKVLNSLLREAELYFYLTRLREEREYYRWSYCCTFMQSVDQESNFSERACNAYSDPLFLRFPFTCFTAPLICSGMYTKDAVPCCSVVLWPVFFLQKNRESALM